MRADHVCIIMASKRALLTRHRKLELHPLVAALRSLEALARERLLHEFDDPPSDSGVSPQQLPYDPVSVFLLEMMVTIICKTSTHFEELW
jgi:brefeldin A-resistance guanine nucleotide exchange factor 1